MASPPEVKKILSDGLNERFSGGLFGNGSYLAEERPEAGLICEKIFVDCMGRFCVVCVV